MEGTPLSYFMLVKAEYLSIYSAEMSSWFPDLQNVRHPHTDRPLEPQFRRKWSFHINVQIMFLVACLHRGMCRRVPLQAYFGSSECICSCLAPQAMVSSNEQLWARASLRAILMEDLEFQPAQSGPLSPCQLSSSMTSPWYFWNHHCNTTVANG